MKLGKELKNWTKSLKVTSPANRTGTYLDSPNKETAQIVVGGSDYYCNADPNIDLSRLKKGTRVLVNEAYVIVGDLEHNFIRPGHQNHRIVGSRSSPSWYGTWHAGGGAARCRGLDEGDAQSRG